MRPLYGWLSHCLQTTMVRTASWIAPGKKRAEWLREWHAELWHVREMARGDAAQRELAGLRFCLGAFSDACCLRRIALREGEPLRGLNGSPAQCVLCLVAVLAASYVLSLVLPGVRTESHPASYRVNSGVILIQDARRTDDSEPTIDAATFRAWKSRHQRYFDGLAFYRVVQGKIADARSRGRTLRIAIASPDLFALLGLPVRWGAPDSEADDRLPKLILGESVWNREFDGNPNAVGKIVHIGSGRARLAGIMPFGAWRLPGDVDAWILVPDSTMLRGEGFVAARLTKLGLEEMRSERVQISPYNSDDEDDDLWGVSLHERTRGPWDIYLLAVILAILSLPAITSVSLGEYSFCVHKPTWRKRVYRWGFLAAKIALLLLIDYFGSLDLAYWHTAGYSIGAQYMQLFSSFAICLLGLRWIMLDQRQRCPVCLKRVTHPAQVGHAGSTFLAWNGTEMICTGGHTLLHVPTLPTSWFDTQRWLYLDSSWEFLFAGTTGG